MQTWTIKALLEWITPYLTDKGVDAPRLCAEMLGKPESYVMIHINDQQKLIFAGTDEAAANCSLTSLGLSDQHTADFHAQSFFINQ